jgi:cytochrome c peroxidase
MKKRNTFFGVAIIAVLFNSCISSSSVVANSSNDIDTSLRKNLATNNVQAIEKPKTNPAKVELGRMLFWDKILSGNKNIACVTCHLMEAATGDALPLSLGEGGVGMMTSRKPPLDDESNPIFVPRNATEIFNRAEFVTLFWDGRVRARQGGHFFAPVGGSASRQALKLWTPAAFALPGKLDNALAAQAMFPPTSDTEMRGNFHENTLGDFQRWDWQPIWDGLIERLLAIDEYLTLFKKAYPDISKDSVLNVIPEN